MTDPKTITPAFDHRHDPDDPLLSVHRRSAEDALADWASGAVQLIDVRRAPARRASGVQLVGAPWWDPEDLPGAPPQSADRPPEGGVLAVFCVHGHGVSQGACETLRRRGAEAYFVSGGFEALIAAGANTEALARGEGEQP